MYNPRYLPCAADPLSQVPWMAWQVALAIGRCGCRVISDGIHIGATLKHTLVPGNPQCYSFDAETHNTIYFAEGGRGGVSSLCNNTPSEYQPLRIAMVLRCIPRHRGHPHVTGGEQLVTTP